MLLFFGRPLASGVLALLGARTWGQKLTFGLELAGGRPKKFKSLRVGKCAKRGTRERECVLRAGCELAERARCHLISGCSLIQERPFVARPQLFSPLAAFRSSGR